MPEATIAELLMLLERERVAQRTDIGSWILTRDPETVRLRTLYRAADFLLPLSHGKHTHATAPSLDARVEQMCECAAQAAEKALDTALADLYRRSARAERSAAAAEPTPPAETSAVSADDARAGP